MSDEQDLLQEFDGTVRLFPLPNLVLFPQILQPLHIFEPRYREMTRDALDGDRLLAMALLQPKWEDHYHDKPAIHEVLCISRIVAEQQLEDGRYNLLVRGLNRARIQQEIPSDKHYRIARVEVLEDIPFQNANLADSHRQLLLEQVPQWFANQPNILKQMKEVLNSEVPLGNLLDIVSFALPFPTDFKQEILATLSVEQRSIILLDRMKRKSTRKFPPDFSEN